MIKLIFTSAILVGSLFFFQTSLVTGNPSSNQSASLQALTPISAIQNEHEILFEQKKEYVEIRIRVGDEVKVIRQYHNCNT
jgi:hypothetical protein